MRRSGVSRKKCKEKNDTYLQLICGGDLSALSSLKVRYYKN